MWKSEKSLKQATAEADWQRAVQKEAILFSVDKISFVEYYMFRVQREGRGGPYIVFPKKILCSKASLQNRGL